MARVAEAASGSPRVGSARRSSVGSPPQDGRRARRWVGPGLFAAGIVVAAALVTLHAVNGATRLTGWWYGNALLSVALTAPGALIAQRRPDNPIGWLLCAAGLSEGLSGAGREYLVYGVLGHAAPGSLWIGWFCDALYQVGIATLPLILLVFPTGRLLTRRWRVVAAAVPVALLLAMTGYLLVGDVADVDGHRVANPAGGLLPRAVTEPPGLAGQVVIVAALLLSAFSIVLRYRRAEGAEREQIKWVAWAGSIAAVEIVTEIVPINPYANVTGSIATVLLAAAIGVAVLRHRLLDIDVVIARTLVFATLSAAVVGLYLSVVVGLGSLLGQSTDLGLPLVATAVVAVAFAPLRQRVQLGVDRLVYGHRSNPYLVVTSVGRQIGASGELALIAETVAQSLKLPYVALVDSTGRVGAEVGTRVGVLLRQPLLHGGRTVGELLVSSRSSRDRFGARERQLLADLALQIAAAVHAVGLSVDLQRSRHRIVTAKEEERRRLRRDLHDGLGPRLAALGLKLDAAGLMVESKPAAARSVIAAVKHDIRTTLDEIRALVRGLRPPALDQLGLVGALREWSPELGCGGVHFAVEGPDRAALPAAVEVAAFWIATEAMTNVVRHAHATRCTTRISVDETLRIEVRDDGVGLPQAWRAGVGAASMAERAAELGGSCTISSDESGTCVSAVLPLGEDLA